LNILDLENASVVLGDTRVLDSLTLSIAAGGHTAILGPNGAGKSTLMKLLTLQLYPVAPSEDVKGVGADPRVGPPPIRVFGQERWNVFELRSQLGIISPDLHDRLVNGNVGGRISARDAVVSGDFASQGLFGNHHVTDAMRASASVALELMGVAHLADATLDRVSTGEARRVLIARALVHEPKALVLDEPTRGLDLVARHQFMEQVRDIARRGVTILLVTHHVEEIIPEIDRVILLRQGRVAFDGPKHEVLTAARLGEVFGSRLTVEESDGYFHVRTAR